MTDLNALLFVELSEVSPWQSEEFSHGMSEHSWLPLEVDGWFCSRFENCTSDADILKVTEAALQLVTDELRICDWDSVCLISEPPSQSRQGYYLNGTASDSSALEPDQLSDLAEFLGAPVGSSPRPGDGGHTGRPAGRA